MSSPVSIMDVAKAAGVCPATVSRTLNGRTVGVRIRQETRNRILALARQMGYQPNQIARDIVMRKGAPPRPAKVPTTPVAESKPAVRQIGLLLTSATAPDLLALLPSLVPTLASAGYRLLIIAVPTDPASVREQVAQLLAGGITGLICCPTLYPAVSASVSASCPTMVLWQGAGKAMLSAVGSGRLADDRGQWTDDRGGAGSEPRSPASGQSAQVLNSTPINLPTQQPKPTRPPESIPVTPTATPKPVSVAPVPIPAPKPLSVVIPPIVPKEEVPVQPTPPVSAPTGEPITPASNPLPLEGEVHPSRAPDPVTPATPPPAVTIPTEPLPPPQAPEPEPPVSELPVSAPEAEPTPPVAQTPEPEPPPASELPRSQAVESPIESPPDQPPTTQQPNNSTTDSTPATPSPAVTIPTESLPPPQAPEPEPVIVFAPATPPPIVEAPTVPPVEIPAPPTPEPSQTPNPPPETAPVSQTPDSEPPVSATVIDTPPPASTPTPVSDPLPLEGEVHPSRAPDPSNSVPESAVTPPAVELPSESPLSQPPTTQQPNNLTTATP